MVPLIFLFIIYLFIGGVSWEKGDGGVKLIN